MNQVSKQLLTFFLFVVTLQNTASAAMLALDGQWLDEDNLITSIVQSENKVVINNKSGDISTEMNGIVSGNTIIVKVDQQSLTGEISEDNLIITWKNGSKWFRDLSGTWESQIGMLLTIEQIGSFVRIKDHKGEVESVGFLKDEGIVVIAKKDKKTSAGELIESKGISWGDGSSWKKKD
jgi:hypothetical protein